MHTYDVRTAFTLQEFGRGVVQTDMHGKIYHCWAISYATFFLLSICPVRTKKIKSFFNIFHLGWLEIYFCFPINKRLVMSFLTDDEQCATVGQKI